MTNDNPGDKTIEARVLEYSNKAISGLKWMVSTTIIWQIVSWVFTILTARILTPTDYGIYALIEAVMPYMLLIAAFYMQFWYVQEDKVDENTEKTFFTLSLLLGLLMFFIGVFSAPLLGSFYNNEEMVLPFQILSFIYIIHSIYLVPLAKLRRDLQFKTIAFMKFWSGITRVILVYVLALMDFGYWALVVGALYGETVRASIVIYHKGLPTKMGMDMDIVKKIFKYGSAATGANILHIIFSTADDIIIGKFLGAEALGYYFMAFYLMDMPLSKFNGVTKPVLSSYFSRIRSYNKKLREIFLGVSKSGLWLIFPVLAGLALVARELVPVVLGDKWLPMIVPLIFLSIAGFFRAFTDHVHPLFLALGKPEKSFKINLLAAIILPVSFMIAANQYGMIGILWGWVLVYPIICLFILIELKKLTDITIWMYIKNTKIPVVCTTIMTLAVLSMDFILPTGLNIVLLLSIKILVGVISYIGASYLLFWDEINKAIKLLRQ